MSCGLLLALTFVLLHWVFHLATYGSVCLGSLTAESCSRAWTQLGVFPSPLLAWALRDGTHAGLIVLLGPSMTCLLPVYTPFLLWQHCGVHSWDSALHCDTLWLAPSYVLFPWMAGPIGSARSQWVSPLLFPEFKLHQVRLWQGCKTQIIVNDTEYHTLIQQEQMILFDAFADSPFLHLSFVDSTCVLYVSILSKLIQKYLRMLVRSMASPLKKIAGIACSTALLLRVCHRAYALLGLVSDCLLAPMWQLFQLLLDSGHCCVDVAGCFAIIRKRKHLT